MRVLIFSSNAATRRQVRQAVRADSHCIEVGTQAVLLTHVASATVDVAVLDGESTPIGGMGLARQLRDEFRALPRLIVLTGRPEDGWLARWSGADAVLSRPIDWCALAATIYCMPPTGIASHVPPDGGWEAGAIESSWHPCIDP